jgi:hypothetical protein
MREPILGALGLLIFALTALGCGDGDSQPDGSASQCGDPSPGELRDLGQPLLSFVDYEDGRYCEVLVVRPGPDGELEADVYNSIAFGSCPQDQWERLDPAVIAEDFPGALIVMNGPRFFLMQEAYIVLPPDFVPLVHTFGEIAMSRAGILDVDPDENTPYTELRVARDNTWRFKAGNRIFELVSPTCETFVMQSFSRIVDPDLRYEELLTLGDSLALPPGWSYRTRVLEEDIDVGATDGVATVMVDDFRNTYQRYGEVE